MCTDYRERKRARQRAGRGAGVDRPAVATGVAGSRFKLFACFGFATALCINSTAWRQAEGDREVRRGREASRSIRRATEGGPRVQANVHWPC